MANTVALDTMIVEQSPDALICSDREGAIVRWSRAVFSWARVR
ncbi:hypothetical protein [Paraburkholderia silvatlantica]|nr:hypothetical protein [Paraburkholderia silvatlantica]